MHLAIKEYRRRLKHAKVLKGTEAANKKSSLPTGSSASCIERGKMGYG
ncbi:MAG: hypothetical protein IPK83_03360 [Planctomycetes bacterium]|nr:hypothetical protein [Planctomycetota bacterium]